MNGELQLKLQAWVDGELTGEDARRMEALVAGDREAASLVGELRMTQTVLAQNEPERAVPASREFYWSQIRRGIERGELAPTTPTPTAPEGMAVFWGALRRFMVPASGLALVMLVAALSVKLFSPTSLEEAVQMIEVENLSEDMSSMSYRSHADKMFVVWVYSKDQPGVADEVESESVDDLLFQ